MSELTCGHEACDRPSGDQYLCQEHARELGGLIREVPWLREQLFVTMAKLDNVRATASPGGSSAPGSAMPMRDLAMDKRRALLMFEVSSVKEIVSSEFAGGIFGMLQDLIRDGLKIIDQPENRIVWGTCKTKVLEVEEVLPHRDILGTSECGQLITARDDVRLTICPSCGSLLSKESFEREQEERAWAEDVAPPMRPKEVCKFLREKLEVRITQKDIENWVKHGHLRGVLLHVPSDKVKPHKAYWPREVLATHQRMHARKRAA